MRSRNKIKVTAWLGTVTDIGMIEGNPAAALSKALLWDFSVRKYGILEKKLL